MNQPRPPFTIVAAGLCPAGLTAGQPATNVVGCQVVNGGTGTWQITCLDPTVLPSAGTAASPNALIAFPGGGSNLPRGVSFGQSASQTVAGLTLFSIQLYRNDTGAAVDFEVGFIIVKWPAV